MTNVNSNYTVKTPSPIFMWNEPSRYRLTLSNAFLKASYILHTSYTGKNMLTKKCDFLLISLLKLNAEDHSSKIASRMSKYEKKIIIKRLRHEFNEVGQKIAFALKKNCK